MLFTVQDGANLHAQVRTLLAQNNALTTQNEAITQQHDINTLKVQQGSGQGQGGASSALRLGDLKGFKPELFGGKKPTQRSGTS